MHRWVKVCCRLCSGASLRLYALSLNHLQISLRCLPERRLEGVIEPAGIRRFPANQILAGALGWHLGQS